MPHGLCAFPSPSHRTEVWAHLLKMVTIGIKLRTCEIGQNQREIFHVAKGK